MQRRIETLEGKAKPGGPRGMPGVKPQSGQRPPREKQNRNPRPHGFARTRMTPTQRVDAGGVSAAAPGCRVIQRTREVIDAPGPGAVTEHVYIARMSSVPAPLLGATGGCGAGKAAPGGQPGQPDWRETPQGGGPAALAHHPVVPGHGARAALSRGPWWSHGKVAVSDGGHCGTQSGAVR